MRMRNLFQGLKERILRMSRGFEKLDARAILPKRSTAKSAGYDFAIPEEVEIMPGEVKLINTFVRAYMQDDEFLAIFIRSSMGIKKGLRLANQVGIIDSDYYANPDNGGHIKIAIKNESDEIVKLTPGERIAQGIFLNYLKNEDDNVKKVRQGGIGSTN